ncbi:hypothetical protein J3Q64DRAFT_1836186 [Phycomyces blakesleeanus]|uniref:Uncharacterized protein n=2 Tax=Phycomyces blakesleeanus TaxID=4837 RepID=A0A167MSY7_PHYB8|nr:hypothetical protein PHYBLDRAFT_145315 [Phycomyces blakesleeanus NRRL 1555(-)]OAD73844.1 hypothetical protein PHYBLDRAFT_145315 [Phycomyces blakesleeanus NRRL 1555(-)]|eukprot:XP_018291884.1 hypothetical protein PHYBLDRAFT_145315 [Phycomyces blakesleeanus NRRL 1555(-)]
MKATFFLAVFALLAVATSAIPHGSDQSAKEVGNEGSVSGVFNNFAAAGALSDNSLKNSVSQSV